METFDLIVIGAGAGGLNVASFATRAGLSVLLVDRDDTHIGGDCLNAGCIPSKALIHAARTVKAARTAAAFGVTMSGEIDFASVKEHIEHAQETIRVHENADYFRKKGMSVVLGEASFIGRRRIAVAGKEYQGKKVVLATGSQPRTLTISGAEAVPVYTNETIFTAPTMPKHLVVIGGGPIGFEIGQAFRQLGSEVALVNRDKEWLQKEDPTVVRILMDRMEKEGVRFVPEAAVSRINGGSALLATESGEEAVPCDALFIAIGREIDLSSLQLLKTGIETDEHGKLRLSQYLETTCPNIYAVGDVVGQHQFTHAAEVHASVVVRNMIAPRLFRTPLKTDHMAWVTYTSPEIATFGISFPELERRGENYEILEQSFTESDRAITDAKTDGLLRVAVGKGGRILGGTMVGEDAGELVQELILAESRGIPLQKLFDRVYPYPTAARINRHLAATYLGRSLTPRATRLIRFLFRHLS